MMSKKEKEAKALLKRLRDDLRERARLGCTDIIPVSSGLWIQLNDFLDSKE